MRQRVRWRRTDNAVAQSERSFRRNRSPNSEPTSACRSHPISPALGLARLSRDLAAAAFGATKRRALRGEERPPSRRFLGTSRPRFVTVRRSSFGSSRLGISEKALTRSLAISESHRARVFYRGLRRSRDDLARRRGVRGAPFGRDDASETRKSARRRRDWRAVASSTRRPRQSGAPPGEKRFAQLHKFASLGPTLREESPFTPPLRYGPAAFDSDSISQPRTRKRAGTCVSQASPPFSAVHSR
jgi:hypothetical protein